MKIFNIYWNHYQKQYFYSEDINTYIVEPCDKIKKNEPIKKFNRWLDKFILLQNEEIENDILLIIRNNFDIIDNIHPNSIKNVLKLYKLNKYYKMINEVNNKLLILENDIYHLFTNYEKTNDTIYKLKNL